MLRSFAISATGVPEDGAALMDNVGTGAIEVGIVTCSNWSWGQDAVVGNASMKSEYADLERAWVEIDGESHEVKLSRGPLISLDRRNEVPASIELDPGSL